jgi:UDP-N-acetylglucosamine/UDP-N-acetyl-alpha-D-glucosaminouronate 4-epimerase
MNSLITQSRILITGGAGFIGSNLVESLLKQDNKIVCLDNFSTGKRENIASFMDDPAFSLLEGDIRDFAICEKACAGIDYVLHQAALGSVPRSIKDPITATEVNITGFVKMLTAAKNAGVKRFVYAASSSTYGDSKELPKVEDHIGNPLSPYAITKYVNELFANNFSDIYGIETIGLRYFNVFGRRQDPLGAYAAVIPKFVMSLMQHEAPIINGDGSYSRDFTYIDNVLQANQLAAVTDNPDAINTVYNVACGERTDLNKLFSTIRSALSQFDPEIANIEVIHGEFRSGDIPHSLADISKAKRLLGYSPTHDFMAGLNEAAEWYWNNLTSR